MIFQEVLSLVKKGQDITINASAGAGKTSTILRLVQYLTDKSFLHLTYNSHLKNEVRHKSQQMALKNIAVHSYHSLMKHFYQIKGFTDVEMKDLISSRKKIKLACEPFDIIVIDEAQDLRPLFYQFMRKFMADMNGQKGQLIILGDNKQSIYQFLGADERYLMNAEKAWNKSFHSLVYKNSFRLTKPMANVVNHLLGYEKVISQKEGSKVVVITEKSYIKRLATELIDSIKKGKYLPEDILILKYSVKTSPVWCLTTFLENQLIKAGIPVMKSFNDEYQIDSKISQGKVLFLNFHQSKGLERKIAVVFDFDENYFFYDQESEIDRLSNILYVACTRGSEKLYLVEERKRFCFFNPELVKEEIDFWGPEEKDQITQLANKKEKNQINATELSKFVSHDLIRKMDLEYEKVLELNLSPKIKNIISFEPHLFEDVSALNGIAIASFYEYKILGLSQVWLFNFVHESITNAIKGLDTRSKDKMIEIFNDRGHPEDFSFWLRMANIYISICHNTSYNLFQIKRYDWFPTEIANEYIQQMKKNIKGTNLIAEKTYQKRINDKTIVGRTDIITNDIVWEIKFKSEISISDKVQLMIYNWITDKETFYLYNVQEGNILKMKKMDQDKLNEIMTALVKEFQGGPFNIDDQAFEKISFDSLKYFGQRELHEIAKKNNLTIKKGLSKDQIIDTLYQSKKKIFF